MKAETKKPAMGKPRIAVISENSLSNMGLKSLLERLIPFAEICTYNSLEEMEPQNGYCFFHFFVSARQRSLHDAFFKPICHQTLVFGREKERGDVPEDYHFFATDQNMRGIMRSLMILQHGGHAGFRHYPSDIASQLQDEDEKQTASLTKREIDILKMVARGLSSKEIAEKMHISLFTVTTHRKNIMEKFHAHSTTKVVVYAVNHGLIKPDEI